MLLDIHADFCCFATFSIKGDTVFKEKDMNYLKLTDYKELDKCIKLL